MKKTEEKITCGKSIVVTLAHSLHSVSRQIKNKEYHKVRIKPRKTLPYLSCHEHRDFEVYDLNLIHLFLV
jgi:hypothetical protein